MRQDRLRVLVAAILLSIAFIDLAGHAISDANGSSPVWCADYHYTNNGVDCPHKRDQRGPERSAFDDTSHTVVLSADEFVELSGITYRNAPPARRESRIVSRTLTPPFHPPKQA